MDKNVKFFYDFLDSMIYDGARLHMAERLAEAEDKARDLGYMFDWIHQWLRKRDEAEELGLGVCDTTTWNFYECVCYDENGIAQANEVDIDFGDDGHPCGQPLRRVIEAQLTLQVFDAIRKQSLATASQHYLNRDYTCE